MTVLINRPMSVCMSRLGSRCVCPYVRAGPGAPPMCAPSRGAAPVASNTAYGFSPFLVNRLRSTIAL